MAQPTRPDDGVLRLGPPAPGHARIAARANAMVFEDPASRALKAELDLLAGSDVTILVTGETGTGKELAARYLHERGRRASGPFVAVNCGALPENLIEAELFGYEKGAYTGAQQGQSGWFEAAEGGTLLLDEIGDLPLALQGRLLRVLQEREVVRVGGRRALPLNIRVIAATNRDLCAEVAVRRFRQDLYYRLGIATVALPPLRQRPGDIGPLARHFLATHAAAKGRNVTGFTTEALHRLVRHPWPGNIRELENTVHRALLASPGPLIEAAALRLGAGMPAADAANLESRLAGLIEGAILEGEAELFERVIGQVVRSAFDLAGGNQLRAADSLGLSRNAFRTRLAELGVIAPRRSRGAGTVAPVELRIGCQPYGAAGLLRARPGVAARLARQGFRLRWVDHAAGPQLLDALERGEIDFCSTGEVPPILAQAAGVPFVYVGWEAPAPAAEGLVVRDGSGIVDVADLAGRRIAVNRGSNVHYLLIEALAARGLGLDDVEIQFLAPDLARHRLESGAVDAWAIWDPLLGALLHRGGFRLLLDGRDLVPNRQFHLAAADFGRRHPAALEALLGELRAAGDHAAANAPTLARRLAGPTGLSAADLAPFLARQSCDAGRLTETVVRQQQVIADRLRARALIPHRIEVGQAVWPI
ncbi:aliphatic sulfonate ABC transporter substrate-binding protein [Zavarzinia sp.]|uniref:aliphatic sulfonate ABC transporter substrate-binding protein n=1 Tax=Zavarzinia sp. TaxID=2027920 RepID=UPI003565F097